jgi:hypothetical protein
MTSIGENEMLRDEMLAIVHECSNPECYICETITKAADKLESLSERICAAMAILSDSSKPTPERVRDAKWALADE